LKRIDLIVPHERLRDLDDLMREHGGFEHNRQTLRILEVLERRYPEYPGLNLTWEVREGIIKHRPDTDATAPPDYAPGEAPTLEAQLVDYVDEIAYNNHDIDDGLKSGYITLGQLREVPLWNEVYEGVEAKHPAIDVERKVFQTISALIGLFIKDLTATTVTNLEESGIGTVEDLRRVNRQVVEFSPELARRNRELKRFLMENLYRHYKVERMRIKAERCLTQLFGTYLKHPTLLPKKYLKKMDRTGRERVISDYIAGMTDRFALDEFKRLFEPYERV